MIRLFKLSCLTFIIAAVSGLFLSCEFDHGLGPSATKITGRVIFDDPAARPGNVDEVRVVATAKFLPDDLGDVYFSTAVRFDLAQSTYEISAPAGTYPVIGVLWKERGKNWDIKKLIGIYGVKKDSTLAPRAVHITKANPVASNVDIFAYWKIN
ncbi:MAG: hypothetical protein ONB46_03635 [candidate division KSB1 bacterium]|nr:hypothetical protein [candidate division KSB1 bacterium]MDZ7364988.1 hypothetical protein [candidate division KSB1 bacterium]MDZ7403383.1 hypothetical protein [candidate division KSB1 bacterium]